MKLKHLAASVALALSSAGTLAVTQDLGTLDSGGTDFNSGYFWRIFDWGSPLGNFVDYYTFSLLGSGSGASGEAGVDFEWGWVDLKLDSVSLYNSGGQFLGTSAPSSFSFAGLGAGSYKLEVAGTFFGDFGVARYGGTIRSVASAAPEASAFGMALLGLTGVGFVIARRRKD